MTQLRRRAVLEAAAAVGVVGGLAAGCGGDEGDSSGSQNTSGNGGEKKKEEESEPTETPTESEGGEKGDGEAGGGTALGSTADVEVGGGQIYKDAEVVVTQPAEGDFKAFSAICKHKGCLVSSVEQEEIVCACHGSRYDFATGAPTQGPNNSGPETISALDPVEVDIADDGTISVP